MYRHAQDFRYIKLYTSISKYILVYTVISVSCDRWKAIELKKTIDMEWQSQLFRGVMRARCYPFDMPMKRFHGFNPKVCNCSLSVDVYVCIY